MGNINIISDILTILSRLPINTWKPADGLATSTYNAVVQHNTEMLHSRCYSCEVIKRYIESNLPF